jgi:cyclopropane fatty-acyl-phospholipid synthase-like methyltransferase
MQNHGQAFDYESMPAGYYDSIHEDSGSLRSKWHRAKFKYVEDRVLSLEYSPKKIVDYACGPGTFLGRYLISINAEKIGLDISDAQIAYAVNKFGSKVTFVKSKSQITQKNVELITAIEFIEHISENELQVFFRDCYELLSDSGTLILTTPNYKGFWPVLEKLTDWLFGTEYHAQHIAKYDKTSLKSLLILANFKVQSIETILNFSAIVAEKNMIIKFIFKVVDLIVTRRNKFLLLAIVTKC